MKQVSTSIDAARGSLFFKVLLAATVVLFHAGAAVMAGVSPENVIVVVNADSIDSRTIADLYVELRDIPSSNVISLREVPPGLKISLEDFKAKILRPVLNQLNERGLSAQTRVIAYSAGFPTSVDISPHTAKLTDSSLKQYQLPTASINGLTYFYQFVLADSEKYLDWGSNLYARGPFERNFANPYFDDERRTRFDNAVAKLAEEKFEQAAEEFEKLFEQSPTFSPLAIRAAEARARANDLVAARRLIEQGVAAGWSSGSYLLENQSLAPVIQAAEMDALRKRLSNLPTVAQEPIGFAGDVGWTRCGLPTAEVNEGVPYMMSCVLAVVQPLGSTVDQATRVLQRAAESDRTFPDAAFWFTNTSDVRTKTRFPAMGDALLWLKLLKHDAQILHEVMPSRSGNCVGLMLGTPVMNLADKKWNFVPGAIAENLTSTSAAFDSPGQTKITELLHAGAAISSGPVQEPYALPFKFPVPMMYGYYASGVSAIEAFYLSVSSPYQLLIVGDPLAQPFARSPADWVSATVQTNSDAAEANAGSGKATSIRVTRRGLPTSNTRSVVQAIEMFVEGRLVRRVPPVATIEMNLPSDLYGVIELRTVLIGNDLTQPRASHSQWLEIKGRYAAPRATMLEDNKTCRLECSGAQSIDLKHHDELIGTVEGETGDVEIDWETLGDGPLRLRPIARVENQSVPGQPLRVERSP